LSCRRLEACDGSRDYSLVHPRRTGNQPVPGASCSDEVDCGPVDCVLSNYMYTERYCTRSSTKTTGRSVMNVSRIRRGSQDDQRVHELWQCSIKRWGRGSRPTKHQFEATRTHSGIPYRSQRYSALIGVRPDFLEGLSAAVLALGLPSSSHLPRRKHQIIGDELAPRHRISLVWLCSKSSLA
jgi:hypothetical protein